jgi:hypothetical protein
MARSRAEAAALIADLSLGELTSRLEQRGWPPAEADTAARHARDGCASCIRLVVGSLR